MEGLKGKRMKKQGRKQGGRQKKRQSLSDQLICMVMITFLPVNLLAIVVSSMILAHVSGQVKEFCQRDLDTVMDRIQEDLMETEDAFSDFLLDYMTELTLTDINSPMANYDMVTDLRDIFRKSSGDGFYYLFDRKENRIYLRCSTGLYSVGLVEEMKKALEEDQLTESDSWGFCPVAGKYFLCRQYDYLNYRIGFLLDMERFLAKRGVSRLWQENNVYLESGDSVYSYQDGHMRFCEDACFDQIFKPVLFDRNVKWQSDNPAVTVGIEMVSRDFRGGVPISYWVLLWVSLSSVLLSAGMWQMLKKRVVNALSLLRDAMEELEKEHLSFRINEWDARQAEEFVFLYGRFNHMAQEIEFSRKKDIQMYQVQLDNLRLQVNPHMLLNSFNMIYCLAQSRNFECIQRYSLLLVNYFRYALKDTGQLVLLAKEMAFVEDYINIQKIRFPGAFTTVYTIQEGCGEAMVPPLLVENFVENAMKYALSSGRMIEVLINIRREEDRLCVSVCDTGRGIKEEILECLKKGEIYVDKMGQQHIGVWNCR